MRAVVGGRRSAGIGESRRTGFWAAGGRGTAPSVMVYLFTRGHGDCSSSECRRERWAGIVK